MANEEGDWQAVNPTPQPTEADGWQPAVPGPVSLDNPVVPMTGMHRAASYLAAPVVAAWSGAKQGFGDEPVGMSEPTVDWLRKVGLFPKDANKSDPGISGIFKAFNQTLLYPLAAGFDAATRAPNAAYHAVGDAAIELGVPRDIVALPEATMGDSVAVHKIAEHTASYFKPAQKVFVPHELTPETLPVAREMGVIGPEKVIEGTPKERAEAMIPSGTTLSDGEKGALVMERPSQSVPQVNMKEGGVPAVTKQPEPRSSAVQDKAGNIRLDLIETHDDAKNIIRQAAEENGGFMEARQGEIRLAHVEGISDATGIPPQELNLKGIGRQMRNDDVLRTHIQAMVQSAEDLSAKMKVAAQTDALPDLLAVQEARMRHNVLQEQVAGLTAEWGRTGNVFQEFREQVKDAQSLGRWLKDKKGESIDDLRNMVKAGAQLDPQTQLPAYMNQMRKPSRWDKFMYYWTNSLLSGPFTHATYALANTLFSVYEAGVVTPTAGVIGGIRTALTKSDAERVFVGEGAARLYGLVAGTPDALMASWQAVKSGVPTLLPRQNVLAAGKNAVTQQKPIGGPVGTVIGLPSHVISAIHTFTNFTGFRAELEARAYRQAASEGLTPFSSDFWTRQKSLAMFAPEEWLDAGVANGSKLTFTNELGPTGQAVQTALKKTKVGQLIVPFMRVPTNIMKAAQEGTPLAFLHGPMRDELMGKSGKAAQDMQWARLVAGSALGAYAVNLAANDKITGGGPADRDEQARWRLTHEPYSVKIGNSWVSYQKFAPLGTIMGWAADLHEVHHAMSEGEYAEATYRVVNAGINTVTHEVGMQGLFDFVQAMKDPQRYGARYVTNFASTMMPYSSLMGQTASMMDPNLRDTGGFGFDPFINAFKYKTPVVREGLPPLRDWMGNLRENPRQSGGSVFKSLPVNDDPINIEMQKLQMHPAPPDRYISGVQLSPKLYEEYQSIAGPLTQELLGATVAAKSWSSLPAFSRETAFRGLIDAARKQAQAALVARHPELIMQGLQLKLDWINGIPKKNNPVRQYHEP